MDLFAAGHSPASPYLPGKRRDDSQTDVFPVLMSPRITIFTIEGIDYKMR